ncbi:MAG: hypothetical protein JRN10_00275 [Nitrososphaerota archaeon]|jgi:hypothetical protein|nr:hypothetical protein [Nitrososphaerota archaeon]MDG6929673.1 hypothetical protein [Nitrososphaerota archaeon]
MLEQVRKNYSYIAIGETEQKLFKYRFFNPGSTLKEAAANCHIKYSAAAMAWSRLKRHHDLFKLCPICYHETLYDGVCHLCGFESGADFEMPGSDSKTQAPVYKLMPFGGLGTQTDYNKLRLKYGGRAIQHAVEHGPNSDRKLETLRDRLLQELKGKYNDDVLEFAARLLVLEYERFRTLYPDLLNKHGMNDLILNAVKRQLMNWLGNNELTGAPQGDQR